MFSPFVSASPGNVKATPSRLGIPHERAEARGKIDNHGVTCYGEGISVQKEANI